MFFTQEDYRKIEKWLHRNSVKDTEFQEALPFTGKEIVTVVQDGHNRKVNIQEFINQLYKHGVGDFLNVTNTYKANNITLKEAIRLIPAEARKEGQVITFLNTDGNWEIYQFIGKLNQWNNPTLWNNPFDWEKFIVDSILPDEEDLTKSAPDANGNAFLSLKDRKYEPDKYSGLGRKILRRRVVEIEDPIYGIQEKNLLLQADFAEDNTVYEIRYNFDLNNQEITIPEGCVLDFQGGSLSNGTINSKSLSKIIYNNSFIGKNLVIGTLFYLYKDVVFDYEVLRELDYKTHHIQTLINLSKINKKTIFSKGIFDDIEHVIITNNIDLDFQGSTINAKIEYFDKSDIYYSKDIFYMPPYENKDISVVKIKNITIDGRCKIDYINRPNPSTGLGPCHRALQLFNVDTVELDSFRLVNYNNGNNCPLPDNQKENYIIFNIGIINYKTCNLNRVSVSYCSNDFICLVPKEEENPNNLLTVTNCTSSKNFGTFLCMWDGKAIIRHNTFEDFNGSAINCFGYDTIVEDNLFRNGQRSVCIDFSEDNMYVDVNCIARNNRAYNCPGGLVGSCGDGLQVYDNIYEGKGGFVCIQPAETKSNLINYNINNPIDRDSDRIGYTIRNNKVIADSLIFVASGSRTYTQYYNNISLLNNDFTQVSEKENNPLLFISRAYNINIDNNNFKGQTSHVMSSAELSIIHLFRCAGILKCVNNYFNYNRSIESNRYGAISARESYFDYIKLAANNSNKNIHINIGNQLNPMGSLDVKYDKSIINSGTPGYCINNNHDNNINKITKSDTLIDSLFYNKGDYQLIKREGESFYTNCICIKEGLYCTSTRANLNSKNSYLTQAYKYEDGSVWINLSNNGIFGADEPIVIGKVIGDTIVDGNVIMTKMSESLPVFQYKTPEFKTYGLFSEKPKFEDGARPPISYICTDISNDTGDSPLIIYMKNSQAWVDYKGREVDENYLEHYRAIGYTSDRPASPYVGHQYFDKSINKPIWWTGSKWVDTTGVDV